MSGVEDERDTVDIGLPAVGTAEPAELAEPAEPTAPASVEAATVHDRHTSRSARPPLKHLSPGDGGRTTVSSPVDALRLADIQRLRVFFKVVLTLSITGIAVAAITEGDHTAQIVVIAGSIGSALAATWLLIVTRDTTKLESKRIAIAAGPVIFGAMAGVYYWGTVSPVTGMLVYGIYFFSLGVDMQLVNWIYGIVAITHGLLGLGIISGVIEDHGLIQMTHLRFQDQLAVLGIIEFLYLVSYITARLSQQVTLDSIAKLEQAVRAVSQRDALLAEARAELDRAMVIGGPGRYTDQLIGSYQLGVLLGRGGMGEVYQAQHVTLHHVAAVKLLHPATLTDPMYVKRFIREAQTVSKLDCPNVVRVLEVGTTSAQIPYLAMEQLRGHDLAHELREKRRISLATARTLVDHLATGLEAARAAGIVHRDLKPHNVFGVTDGESRVWKILDFGVSKMGGSGTLTKDHIVGTPAYMAPEQARGENVDHRADVYSLAAILFRCVTGHPAFTEKDLPTTLYEVVYRMPTQPSKLMLVPLDIDRVLAIGLAKDVSDRFSTAVELARWFSAAVDNGLTPAQRRTADALISRAPWGARRSDNGAYSL